MTTSNAARRFEDKPAIREATPLLLGLIGPSGSGKTFSALRLATGIQRVSGGEIFLIDTESRRALHYAEKFKFRHVQFGAPFGSLDYLDAIEHCVAKGAKTIIVDSMSHEHEGPGGVLEQHAEETKRLAALWKTSEAKAQLSAWSKPKADRRRMINTILQINANIIFCFRAKEKLKIIPGKDPENMGFMPIAGEEFVYEMVLKCLLLPGARGTPTWESNFQGERMMMKIPEQFLSLFGEVKQLDEDTGMKLAQWAAGAEPVSVDSLIAAYEKCADQVTFAHLEAQRGANWGQIKAADKARLKTASEAASKRAAAAAPKSAPSETYTLESAIQALREAGDLAGLDEAWNAIVKDFSSGDVELPLDVEAVYNDRKEVLQDL